MSDSENIVNNIILDSSTKIETALDDQGTVLFSSLKSDAKPIVPYDINLGGIEYPQLYSPKCAICNSPHRTLLEHAYIDCGKKINTVIVFFQKHYAAKLNWIQVKQHVNYHCDFNKIETPGLKDYEGREEELSRWKYREYELALTAVLVELDTVRGKTARTLDDTLKKSSMIEKLTRQLLLIKQQRDDSSQGLPNVFEVLYDVHEKMVDDRDKRIIREKVNDLKKTIT